jgi:spermidine/putrescine transport system substrate-binding protein
VPAPSRVMRTAAIALAVTLLLTACQVFQGSEPNELLVLEWSGYEAEDFWTDFAQANPDTDVTFEFGDTDANILAIMQGGSQADIFHFYTGWQQFYVDEGLVREIDTSKLTNWDKVPAEYQALGQIDGKQYFVPWDWGFTSILYNTEQVPEVTSWDALFNPDYAGHISMWNDGPGAVGPMGPSPRPSTSPMTRPTRPAESGMTS